MVYVKTSGRDEGWRVDTIVEMSGAHYPHIPPLGYLHTSFSRLPSSVLPPNPPKR